MRVVIAGFNHSHQWSFQASWWNSPTETKQKENYREWLKKIVDDGNIQFIGEEANWATYREARGQPVETIGQQVANECGVAWYDIDMSPAERQSRGIPLGYGEENSSPDQFSRWHREREEYMFGEIMRFSTGVDEILVICGHNHMEALAGLFQEQGHVAKTRDMTQEGWYISHELWTERDLQA